MKSSRPEKRMEMYDRIDNRARYRNFYEFGKRVIFYAAEDKNDYETFLKYMSCGNFTKCEADFYKKYIEERLGPSVRVKKNRKKEDPK
jgi:hypothetical protein